MNETASDTHPDMSFPTRRERLRALMKLRSHRRIFGGGLAAFAALTAVLALSLTQANSEPDVVPLGNGLASVDAQSVARLAPARTAEADAIDPPFDAAETAIAGGEASYYGSELAGNRTASGETFDPEQLTAAHRTLPLGSKVRVTNPRSGENVVVRINDRGPFHGNRVIDLSTAAARAIGLLTSGTGRVTLALLTR